MPDGELLSSATRQRRPNPCGQLFCSTIVDQTLSFLRPTSQYVKQMSQADEEPYVKVSREGFARLPPIFLVLDAAPWAENKQWNPTNERPSSRCTRKYEFDEIAADFEA